MTPEEVAAVTVHEREQRAHTLMEGAQALLNASGDSCEWVVYAVDQSRHTSFTLASEQAALALMWGDRSVTTLRDDGAWTENGLDHPTPLQRQLMVARLRYAADLLEQGPEGVNP